MKRFLLMVLIIMFFSINSYTQKLGKGWKLSGQIQIRSELDGRDFSNNTHPLTFSSMRTRLGIKKSFEDKLSFFVQISDSRIFGEEQSSLKSINRIDLHQGYIKLNNLFDWKWSLQVGRFEVSYGTQRFFGAVGWHFVGRSFDGIRFNIAPKKLNLDLFALTVKESNKYIGNAKPSIYPNTHIVSPSNSIYGFWQKNVFGNGAKLDLFGYYDVNRTEVAKDTKKLSLFTVGSTFWGKIGKISTIVEGGFQFGSNMGKDVSAYLVSAKGAYNLGNTKLGFGVDILSGTNPSKTNNINTFSPSYGTNHKFYGFMDYFINVPVNSNNLGLNDFYVSSTFTPKDSKFLFKVVLHHFMSNKSANILVGSAAFPTSENIFGQEADLIVKYKFIKGTTLTWGGSFFLPGNLMKFKFNNRDDVAFWSYFMLTASL